MQSVDQNVKNFWKKSNKSVPGKIRPVYGAMHPPIMRSPKSSPRKEGGQKKSEESDSFEFYQESVNDAWDCADDDIMSGAKISKCMAHSAAQTVLNIHRSGQLAATSTTSLPGLHSHHNSPTQQDSSPTSFIHQSNSPSFIPHHHHVSPPSIIPQHSSSLPHTTFLTHSASLPSSESVPASHSPDLFSPPPNSLHASPIAGTSAIDSMLPLSRLDPANATLARSPVICPAGGEAEMAKQEKFLEVISSPKTDLDDLRNLSWSGIPPSVRAVTWRLLNDYLPANSERRDYTLKRKREEYWGLVKQYYDTRHEDNFQDIFRQIQIDVPRMSPLVPLFQQIIIQEMFERILYIWSMRRPASGYVQGINDLVTPFFIVFLHEAVPKDENLDTYEVAIIPESERMIIEADSYWCMSNLVDRIQCNYIFATPGIQTKVIQLGDLMKRIDSTLHQHLIHHEIDYLQFAFRWFNNLLMRELPLSCIVRMWDTLQSEQDGFTHFVVYVCAAFLTHFSQLLLAQKDFQSLMLLLQNLPTTGWSNKEISVLMADAYRLKFAFADAPNHLQALKK